jgi:hypothetical protein
MVKEKEAFHSLAALHGVKIIHYHTNSRSFQENAFCQSISANNQAISFCGINAHWQNDKIYKMLLPLYAPVGSVMPNEDGRIQSPKPFVHSLLEWQMTSTIICH